MPKQIIVLDVMPGEPGPIVRYAMWIPVPSAYKDVFSNPAASSSYKGATVPEVSAIQSGQVMEVIDQTQINSGWNMAQIKSELVRNYSSRVNTFNASTAQYIRYGISWDGTNWSS